MNRFISISLLLLLSFSLKAQDETSERLAADSDGFAYPYALITNVSGRTTTSLAGRWDVLTDQYDNGFYNYRMKRKKDSSTYFADKHYWRDSTRLIEYDFDRAESLYVPGDWNTQKEKLYFYEGSIWYRKLFSLTPAEGKRYFLYFGAANYDAVVGINGNVIGHHIGGFTPFCFEVSSLLKDGENSLVVKVNNNRILDGVPTINSDWWNYGGLTRDVKVIETPDVFIRDYFMRLDESGRKIEGWVQLDGEGLEGRKVSISIPELKWKVSVETDESGKGYFSKSAKPQRWSTSSPKLYAVDLSAGSDAMSDKVGFRTICTRGSSILLNDEPVFLKGVAIHEERLDGGGRAWSREHAESLLSAAKELGCNFVRLAHYPHNENMVRVADSLGLMVWSEIPVYWTISWKNRNTFNNAMNQLNEMITRDRNRASVVIWSVGNETPRSPERYEFLSALVKEARRLDGSRLVSAAMEKESLGNGVVTVQDELLQDSNLISFNQYIGWYDGSAEKCGRVSWTFPVDKPVVITEWGAGVKYGYHGGADVKFTEEYGVEVYKAQIAMQKKMPQLAGTCPWIMKDFRSPRRQLVGIQDDYNRKGVLSEKGEKKKIWYVLRDWYESL